MRQLLLPIFLFSSFCYADTIFQQVDKNGNVTFTDTPLPNSQPLTITPTVTASSPQPSQTQTTAKPSVVTTPPPATEIKLPYKSLAIISPTDQQTFQNQRQIPVQVQVDPKLQQGDKIQLRVDGTAYGPLVEGTQLALGQLDRGTHTVSAVIIDSNNAILKASNTVTVFIHFATLGVAPNPP